MVTTPKNSPWHDRTEVKKGDYGEALFQNLLANKGYVIYRPVTDGSHGFDMLAYRDGKYQFGVEVKTKPMCWKYPETGFNKSHFDRYCELCQATNLPLLIAFVDEDKRAIYGNYLSELVKPKFIEELGVKGYYPKFTTHSGGRNATVYFHKSSMHLFRVLTDEEVDNLKHFAQEESTC